MSDNQTLGQLLQLPPGIDLDILVARLLGYQVRPATVFHNYGQWESYEFYGRPTPGQPRRSGVVHLPYPPHDEAEAWRMGLEKVRGEFSRELGHAIRLWEIGELPEGAIWSLDQVVEETGRRFECMLTLDDGDHLAYDEAPVPCLAIVRAWLMFMHRQQPQAFAVLSEKRLTCPSCSSTDVREDRDGGYAVVTAEPSIRYIDYRCSRCGAKFGVKGGPDGIRAVIKDFELGKDYADDPEWRTT